ncbi:MAG: hypothetical protein U1E59_17905 [Amaricoccus sp.]
MFAKLTILATLAYLSIGTIPTAAATTAGAPVPRHIVAVFDGNADREPRFTRIHRYAELPLNYLGYQVDYLDLSRQPLPDQLDADVAAVLVWFEKPPRESDRLVAWAATVGRAGQPGGLRMIALGNPGLPLIGSRSDAANAYLARLGLEAKGYEARFGVWSRPVSLDPTMVGFEREFSIPPGRLSVLAARAPAVSRLRVASDPAGSVTSDLVVTGPGGGYAADAALVREDGSGFGRWILDPFAFFQAVLDPGLRPIPDVSTLSGRRIFFSTISGEGWTTPAPAERLDQAPELAGAIVLDQFLNTYPDIPATLSLVTGDLDPALGGGFAAQGAALAKAAFSLPQVEPASRSRTLPARWGFFEDYRRDRELAIVDRLGRVAKPSDRSLVSEAVSTLGRAFAPPDANAYLGRGGDAPRLYMLQPFDLDAETRGSLEAVAALTPDRKAAAFAWSGDAQPFEAALASVRAAGAEAVGGGGGVDDPTIPTLTNVAPIGVQVGTEHQIYAALSGDAAFTNFWSAPAHGFLRLDRTVEATESPRRLKPYELSYAAYSALGLGLRNAVHYHLDRVRAAPLVPIAGSEYAAIAQGFATTRIVELGPLRWSVAGRGALATLRFDRAGGIELDSGRSEGITGSRREGETLYVGLDPAREDAVVALRSRVPQDAGGVMEPPRRGFELDNARWQVRDLARGSCSVRFAASGFGPGEMSWRVPAPGLYGIEVADPDSGKRIYWDQLTVGPDDMLTTSVPAVAAERPVVVSLSRC